MENVNGAGSASCDLSVSGVHTIYTILNEPVSPWVNTAGNKRNAWTKALDFAIISASCNGNSTASNALSHIAQYLHTGHGLTYDTKNGTSAYFQYPMFHLTDYIDKAGGSNVFPARADNVVNCYDQAGGVCMLGNVLGITVEARFMQPFGYINIVNLVGVGNCNNPFCGKPEYPSAQVTGADDLTRSAFWNHMFTRYGSSSNVYDAGAGPSTGTRAEAQYVSDTVDTSTSGELNPSGWPSPAGDPANIVSVGAIPGFD